MRKQMGTRAGLAIAALLASLSLAATAHAARLDKDACEALKTEQASLVGAGVRDQMAKGPEWAKANLAKDKLAGIQRLIEVEEQIAFRCERPRPAVVTTAAPPVEGEETAPAAAPKAGAKAVSAEPATDAAPTPPKKKRKPKPPAAAAAAPAETPAQPAVEAAPQPAPKKKTARKPADAFIPPDPAPPAAQATPKSVKPSTE